MADFSPISSSGDKRTIIDLDLSNSPKPNDEGTKPTLSQKGIEQAKKRLRAFSIQKKLPVAKTFTPTRTTSMTQQVVIGKLSAKTTPKTTKPVDVEADPKRMPKPPKPGGYKRQSYEALKLRTLGEIEEMKKKMELAELGIPLGLIGPDCSDRAMPTNSMPPMKAFLSTAQLDEIIEEAKKAKAAGKQYKFDYNKFIPEYDNPFQPKKQQDKDKSTKDNKTSKDNFKEGEKETYRDPQKHREHDKAGYYRYKWDQKHMRPRHRSERDRRDYRDKKEYSKHKARYEPYSKGYVKIKEEPVDKPKTDTEVVNLSEFYVCDSWSLDTEDKVSPLVTNEDVSERGIKKTEKLDENIHSDEKDIVTVKSDNLKDTEPIIKDTDIIKEKEIEKLQPVTDIFKYEIDDDEPEIFEKAPLSKFIKHTFKKVDISPPPKPSLYDPFDNIDSQSSSVEDKGNDDTFLESVINEIKDEVMSDEELGDKGFLVEYEMTPEKDISPLPASGSSTPEIELKNLSVRSNYSDGYNTSDSRKSMDSDRKSMESGYRSTESGYKHEKHNLGGFETENQVPKATLESLETWSFVLKICQPLLFRHDKNKCYRQTKTSPSIWYTQNPKICSCVRDRLVVYQELDSCKRSLVDRVYGCDQLINACCNNTIELKIEDSPKLNLDQKTWYPKLNQCLTGIPYIPTLTSNWETDESSQASEPSQSKIISNKDLVKPRDEEELSLDKAYQRFMDAVLQSDCKNKSREASAGNTPTKEIVKEKKEIGEGKEKEDSREGKKEKKRKVEKKVCTEDWSEDSEEKKEQEKVVKKTKSKNRKRKHSTTSSTSDSEEISTKKKKRNKTKTSKKSKLKKKKQKVEEKKTKKNKKDKNKRKTKKSEDSEDVLEEETEKKSKKNKKDKTQSKSKKKTNKHKKKESSSSSLSSESSSESDSEKESKKRRKLKKKKALEKQKNRKRSLSGEFDINILNNIKTERLTDDEKLSNMTDFSPRRQQSFPQKEIINVKELQLAIKQESMDDEVKHKPVVKETPKEEETLGKEVEPEVEPVTEPKEKEPKPTLEDIINVSQSSSQESSVKETFEKDDSHLRPPSSNSNFSFNDVLKSNHQYYPHDVTDHPESDEQNEYEYRQNYDRFDSSFDKTDTTVNRIEVVKISSSRGEIKYDWRAGRDGPRHATTKPSRWGYTMTGSRDKDDSHSRQKPGQANIVLTGDSPVYPIRSVLHDKTYKIETISSNRDGKDSNETSYDEAYLDMYGASDRLQYGDCFAEVTKAKDTKPTSDTGNSRLSLDDRIDKVLRVDVVSEPQPVTEEQPVQENGILLNSKEGLMADPRLSRSNKRVSFADGYKPGQDSDTEQPPKQTPRRTGAPWPVPAWHPDHVPLWDALPPPPPPPGSPPRLPFSFNTNIPPPIPAMLALQPPNMLPFPTMPQHAMTIN